MKLIVLLPRVAAGVALAALSAGLLTLAFPPFEWWLLVWVAFVPVIVAQHRVMPGRLGGLAYGLAIGGFFWGYFGDMFASAGPFMAGLPLIVGVIATFMSSGDRAFHTRTGYRWFVLHGAVVWVGIEAIRGFLPVVGTGGFVAYALYAQPWLIQPVGYFSIYGLSLLVLTVNYAIGLLVLGLIDRRLRPTNEAGAPGRVVDLRLARNWTAGVGVVTLVWAGASVAMLDQASVPGSSVRVASIQPGPVGSGADGGLQKLVSQTRLLGTAGQSRPQIIVWNEWGLDFDPQVSHTPELRNLARETDAYLVIGYHVGVPAGSANPGATYRNEATVLAPDGTFLGRYGKDHPYIWMGETASSTHGTYPAYRTPLGVLGTILCYDLDFTDTARKVAANGAQIVAVPSQDGPGYHNKQYTYVVFRAVENRISLVKADIAFDSAIIEPTGRIVGLVASSTPQEAVIQATIPLGRANSPLIHWGDWLGWVCAVGIAFFIALAFVTGKAPRQGTAMPEVSNPPQPQARIEV